MTELDSFTHAIVGRTISRIQDGSQTNDAQRQHACLLRLLQELELKIIEVDIEKLCKFPESVFLDNLAIICNGTALLSKGAEGQTDKVKSISKILESDLGLSIVEIGDKDARLSGSDVLFTGREFFVSVSDQTNEGGACAVASTFPEYPCSLIKASAPVKALKNYITMGGPDVLCVSSCSVAKDLLKKMEREASFSYRTLTLPEPQAANCIYVNGTLIHRAIEEIPESFKVFCERIEYARRSICFSELSKMSPGLSECCLLVSRPQL